MKIDERMINYEINKNLPKTVPGGNEKIDQNNANDRPQVDGKETPSKQDAIVSFSNASKEAQRISDVIAATPDVREEKVAEIKAKIDSGSYKVDFDAVADKLVDDAIEELF